MVKDPDTGACQGRNIQGTDMVKDPDPAASFRELFRVLDGGRRSPAASFLLTADPSVLFASRDAIGHELALIGHEWALMITQAVRELFRALDGGPRPPAVSFRELFRVLDGGRRSPAASFLRTADPSVLFASRDAIRHELAVIGHELALMITQAVRELFRALDGGPRPPAASFLRTADPRLFASRDAIGQ